MKPTTGGDVFTAQSQKSSPSNNHAPLRPPMPSDQSSGTTFFLTDERSIQGAAPEAPADNCDHLRYGSTFGVRALEGSGTGHSGTLSEEEEGVEPGRRGRGEQQDNDELAAESQHVVGNIFTSQTSEQSTASPRPDGSAPAGPSPAIVFTAGPHRPRPYLLTAAGPELSIPSSPRSLSSKSFRHEDSDSVADCAASQAVFSSDDEDAEESSEVQDSAPQLVMPSIKMPSRRPFTDKGKRLGRLKVLVAGGSGSGKTSLIKSIVQTCEDIVHVDPIGPSSLHAQMGSSRRPDIKGKGSGYSGTSATTEVFASTKPYPSWWSDLDDSRLLRRRKSFGDSVLERNLCFVDTPGYRKGASSSDVIDSVVHYVETQFHRIASTADMTDGEMTNFLTGNGGPQVDIVFFMISERATSLDIELMRQLSSYTNIIPIVSKSDLLTQAQIQSRKTSILNAVRNAGLSPFLFGTPLDEALHSDNPTPPFSASSATTSDSENMDASLLMSPDYVQPLAPSELDALIARVFEPDSISWLRHAAAKKYILWRKLSSSTRPATRLPQPAMAVEPSLYTEPVSSPSSSPLISSSSESTSSRALAPPTVTAPSHALARIAADGKQQEERLAHARLAKWASSLQRSLQNERDRFETLARGERAIWLTERLGDCVADGTLVPISVDRAIAHSAGQRPGMTARMASGAGASPVAKRWAALDHRDPLGLLRSSDMYRDRGWIALQLVGGLGLVGGLALWMVKNWHMVTETMASWRQRC